ncbi:hypothetical protein CEXT_290321, partial [Caerostris extrusa]
LAELQTSGWAQHLQWISNHMGVTDNSKRNSPVPHKPGGTAN